ncbi:Aminodeoxyfutalosine synthase [Enhygromyxa salina]|uniref:Aminodeoxyfutalosine synthase n=2 Tax=Enhygromyxa salina TaxID=215803 RepID=A0A2S9YQ42_9BACT|nr:Aminodeoxyfutalosine synthase [Enhygromyxa salina]
MPDTHELPNEMPARFDAATLLALRHNPPRMGLWAMEVRGEMFDARTLLRPTPVFAGPPGPAVLRRDEFVALEAWPEPDAWQPGDRVMIPVESTDEASARRYVAWLLALAEREANAPTAASPHLGPCAVAPFSSDAAGTHRLWAISAARLALPASIRVEARHDLIGIRLAQVALGFGADTLAGPVSADRHLPVAGVTRPDETSITGLRNLIEQAGLECALHEDTASRALETGRQTVRIELSSLDLPARDPKK